MSSKTLAAHVAHIQNQIPNGHQYKIDAHHTQGNSHVMFHATPLHHDATVAPHQGVRHAVLNPGDSPNNVLVTSDRGHRSTIHQQLSSKTHPQGGAPRDPNYHKQSGAGGTTIGRIPIAREEHRHGMTKQDLQAHAHYVHNLVTKHNPELREKVHVHVTHRQGDGHVDFHAIPGQQHVSPQEVQAHLHLHGDSHYTGGPIAHDRHSNLQNPNVDHKFTWHGSVPAHTTAQMSPQELQVYAQHAKDRIVAHHGLQGPDADNMVMAAVHKEGDTHVHFHSQPTQSLVVNRNQGLHPGRPGQQTVDPIATRLSHAISTANGGQAPWHHAEAGALYGLPGG